MVGLHLFNLVTISVNDYGRLICFNNVTFYERACKLNFNFSFKRISFLIILIRRFIGFKVVYYIIYLSFYFSIK